MTDSTLTITETYYPNGQIESRIYHNAQGQFHNPNGPAIESWYEDGQIYYQVFYLNDELHNHANPAVYFWREDGHLFYQKFYLNGEELTEQDWKTKQ